MKLFDVYKGKPNTYFFELIKQYASKRDNQLYMDKHINIDFVEYKLGILILLKKNTELREIEKAIIPVNNIVNPKSVDNKNFIINLWDCDISNSKSFNSIDNKNIQKNKYILNETIKSCNVCNGTGKLVCKLCNGDGELVSDVGKNLCYECDGGGFEKCDTCNGKGYIKYVYNLIQTIKKEEIEKTFIIDELGGVQIIHKALNMDVDFLKSFSREELEEGKLKNELLKIGLSKEISENLLINMLPFFENYKNDEKTFVEEVFIYSCPVSFVYAKLGKNKNQEIFIFAGKDYDIIEKENLFKYSTDLEKEFRLITANISFSDGLTKNKLSSKKIILFTILGTIIFTIISFFILFYVFKFPYFRGSDLNFNNLSENSIEPNFYQFEIPYGDDCVVIDTEEKLNAFINYAEIYVKNNDLNIAINVYKFIANCYEKSDLRKENIHIFKRIAEIYIKLGEYNNAIDFYSKAFVISKDNRLLPEQAFFLEKLANLEKRRENYEQAINYLITATELYKRLGDIKKELYFTLELAIIYGKLDSINKSYELLNYVLNYASEIQDVDILSKALLNLAEIEMKRGLYVQKTEDYLVYARTLVTETQNKEDIAKLNLLFGKFYYNKGKIENNNEILYKSEEYLNQAGHLYLEIEDYDNVATTLNLLGIILHSFNRYEEAAEKFEMAIKIREELNMQSNLAMNLYNLAKVRESQGYIADAITLMEKVVKIEEKLNLPYLEEDKKYLNRLREILEGITGISRGTTDDILSERNLIGGDN